MVRGRIITRKYFPPGFNYEREWKWAFLLFGGGVVVSLRYYLKLYRAIESLYYYEYERWGDKIRWVKVFKEGELVEPFGRLVEGDWMFFVPFFLYLTAMMVVHYMYYKSTEKCLYLMRRLPGRGKLLKSCVQVPLFGVVAGAVCLAVLYFLYYIVYLIMVPKGCLP
ncbi:MAG: hypothetical protein K2N63_14830 [Lachnospiraceae bacterium]|nr:hypothetical protein [Lachnospiraceae bacterium]